MNWSIIESLVASPFASMFDAGQLSLIIITFFFFLMLIFRLELGAILIFAVVMSIWLIATGFAGAIGTVILAVIVIGGILLVYSKRATFG